MCVEYLTTKFPKGQHMRKNRHKRHNPQTRVVSTLQTEGLWFSLVERGETLVLSVEDMADSRELLRESWPLDDAPYPLLCNLEVFMASFLGRAKAAKAAKGKAATVNDVDFAGMYPAISEYLYAVTDDEGKPRQTATLMVFADGGAVKMLLNDRQTQQSLWAQGLTFEAALGDLEQRIRDESASWRDNTTGKRTR